MGISFLRALVYTLVCKRGILMKTKTVFWLCAAVAVLSAVRSRALPTGRDVYFGSHAEGSERTLYRDGVMPMPSANRLQPILTIDGVNDGVWTNAARNYLYGNDVLYAGALAATTLGSDPLQGGYADGSGE